MKIEDGKLTKSSVVSDRIEACKKCPNLSKLRFCTQCGCFMPAKVRIMSAECPIRIWGKFTPPESTSSG